MSIQLQKSEFFLLNTQTRMPFRYGITTMTELPHLFVRVTLRVDGQVQQGMAADGLPPKWFTKNPDTSFADDVDDMLTVVRMAARLAEAAGAAETPFALWQRIHERQQAWAQPLGFPPLLWGLGVSLVERAVIDGFCRAQGLSFAQAVRTNALGMELGTLHPELSGQVPAALLPAQPREAIQARHTVGLSDPLTEDDIQDADRVHDGLPQSLVECIRTYGLTHFKLKINGDPDGDIARLRQIATVLTEHAASDYAFTLDGNEQYKSIAAFRSFWEKLRREASLTSFMEHLLFVEQPLHRDIALKPEVGRAFAEWAERPPILIDESDGALDSLRVALELGYHGTSYKNCKGVFKGIANACLLEHLNRTQPGQAYLISGEDLANIGPIALLQDLAALATLGVDHAERNGHHYFAGLSMMPVPIQDAVLTAHGDLYHAHVDAQSGACWPALQLADGQIKVKSVVDAPFGYQFAFDPSLFTPIEQ